MIVIIALSSRQVGMISLGSPKIDFQHENPSAYDRLMEEISKHVTEEDTQGERNPATSTPGADNNHIAFQVNYLLLLTYLVVGLLSSSSFSFIVHALSF